MRHLLSGVGVLILIAGLILAFGGSGGAEMATGVAGILGGGALAYSFSKDEGEGDGAAAGGDSSGGDGGGSGSGGGTSGSDGGGGDGGGGD
jgi:hypothetical protein